MKPQRFLLSSIPTLSNLSLISRGVYAYIAIDVRAIIRVPCTLWNAGVFIRHSFIWFPKPSDFS